MGSLIMFSLILDAVYLCVHLSLTAWLSLSLSLSLSYPFILSFLQPLFFLSFSAALPLVSLYVLFSGSFSLTAGTLHWEPYSISEGDGISLSHQDPETVLEGVWFSLLCSSRQSQGKRPAACLLYYWRRVIALYLSLASGRARRLSSSSAGSRYTP